MAQGSAQEIDRDRSDRERDRLHGYAHGRHMSRYQDFGFRGVIAKPYEAAELGKIVHEVIESSHVNILPDYPMQAAG